MNILVVDDDKLVCSSLKIIIEAEGSFNVIGLGYDGTEAITLYDKHQPDILLMDIRMQNMNGLEAAIQILTKYPQAKILLLTTFQDDEYIIKALHIGVKGYLLKQDFESIIPALQTVLNGQSVFGREIMNKIPTLLTNASDSNQDTAYNAKGITDKEYEIIELVASGLSNREISEKLYLSEGTIRNYLSLILEKLELRDRTQLAIYYFRH